MNYYLVRYRDNGAWSEWITVSAEGLPALLADLAFRGLGDYHVKYNGKM